MSELEQPHNSDYWLDDREIYVTLVRDLFACCESFDFDEMVVLFKFPRPLPVDFIKVFDRLKDHKLRFHVLESSTLFGRGRIYVEVPFGTLIQLVAGSFAARRDRKVWPSWWTPRRK